MFSIVVVCLFVCLLATLRKNFRTDLHEIFTEGWADEETIKFWWRSRSPSGYRDCFPDSSLLGDTESGINRLRCATLQCTACASRHRHSNYNVITSPALGRGMHWFPMSSITTDTRVCALMLASLSDTRVVLTVHQSTRAHPCNEQLHFIAK